MSAVDKGDLTLSVMYPSEYLKAGDLQGRNITVTVADVKVDAVPMTGGKKEKKCVVHIHKTKKKLIVGKTNAYCLGLLISSNARDWIGKRITLCPDVDKMSGVEVATIRIAGSPDAIPARAAKYASVWKGERKQGRLVSRVKAALALIELSGAPPVEAEEVAHEQTFGETPADDEPDMFAEETPALSEEEMMRQIAAAPDAAAVVAIERARVAGAHLSPEASGRLQEAISARLSTLT